MWNNHSIHIYAIPTIPHMHTDALRPTYVHKHFLFGFFFLQLESSPMCVQMVWIYYLFIALSIASCEIEAKILIHKLKKSLSVAGNIKFAWYEIRANIYKLKKSSARTISRGDKPYIVGLDGWEEEHRQQPTTKAAHRRIWTIYTITRHTSKQVLWGDTTVFMNEIGLQVYVHLRNILIGNA